MALRGKKRAHGGFPKRDEKGTHISFPKKGPTPFFYDTVFHGGRPILGDIRAMRRRGLAESAIPSAKVCEIPLSRCKVPEIPTRMTKRRGFFGKMGVKQHARDAAEFLSAGRALDVDRMCFGKTKTA
jgi:hypothetical protein